MTPEVQGEEQERVAVFAAHRPYLFALGYRLLGVAEDAEDVLQDAWLRFAAVDLSTVENARAYLSSIVTRLALDVLRSARRRREEYVGDWLPEPVPTSEALPEDLAEVAESASFAFLLLMERLKPLERAELVLHDVFSYSHEEIARMTDRTVASSRQTLHRARLKLKPLPSPPRVRAESESGAGEDANVVQAEALLEATRAGDVVKLMSLLAPDVALVSDGGGLARVIGRPLTGAMQIARFLVTMTSMPPQRRMIATSLNGQPAIVMFDGDRLDTVWVIDTTPAGVTSIYVQRNPEKLRRLGQVLGLSDDRHVGS